MKSKLKKKNKKKMFCLCVCEREREGYQGRELGRGSERNALFSGIFDSAVKGLASPLIATSNNLLLFSLLFWTRGAM